MDTLGLKNQLSSKSSAKERHTGNSFKRSHTQLTDEFPEMLSTIYKNRVEERESQQKKENLPFATSSTDLHPRVQPTGAANENVVQNHINIALLNVL